MDKKDHKFDSKSDQSTTQGETAHKDTPTDSFSAAKDNVSRITDDLRDRAGRMAHDAGNRATDVYDDASLWLQQNYSKALLVVGVLATAGVVGFLLARKGKRADTQSQTTEPKNTTPKNTTDTKDSDETPPLKGREPRFS